MPDHWDIARGLPFPGLMKLLIYIAGGRTTMEELWAGTYPGSPTYSEWRDEMRERMAHINVVVSTNLSIVVATFIRKPNRPGCSSPRSRRFVRQILRNRHCSRIRVQLHMRCSVYPSE